jgi:hypothetical protein
MLTLNQQSQVKKDEQSIEVTLFDDGEHKYV